MRFAFCGGVQTLAMAGLGMRLAFLHLGPHDLVRDSASRTRSWTAELDVERGRIFDRVGDVNILALDLPVKDVCADPQTIVSNRMVGAVAAQLAELLKLPADEVAVKLNQPDRRYVRIQAAVHREDTDRIEALDIPGVFLREQTVRYYPHHDFMSHILGFVNLEGIGSSGVELRMDKFLRGSPGLLESEKNALRQELYWKRGHYIPAIEGADVYLTTDQFVQYIVEKALDSVVAEHQARGAWAIVQRVRTGEILALASRPSYDLNAFRYSQSDERLNRAIGYVYEPGSTMKALVFSAVLNEKLVTPDSVVDCENGQWWHGGRLLRDLHGGYGRLTVEDGLKKSSNILSAKLALMLGEERFYHYLRAFGVGSRLGVDLPGEEAGILHPPSSWSSISASRLAIGQGVAVTALQMLNVFCTIANDGVAMRPYIVDRVVAKDGTVLHQQKPEPLSRPITAETAATMRYMLTRVTEDGGTGRRARLEGYRVAGKTGTAQKAVAGGYSSTAHVASFVGFLPADAPEIGVIVVVDEPQPHHTGGVVAGPAFQSIIAEAVRYLDIPPSHHEAFALR